MKHHDPLAASRLVVWPARRKTSAPAGRLLLVALLLLLGGWLPRASRAQAPDFDWAQVVGMPLAAYDEVTVMDLAVDAAGNSYVVGSFHGSARFGAATFRSANSDVFVAKLDARGNLLWALQGQGDNQDYGNTIALDAGGNVYVAGAFASTPFSLGGLTLPNSAVPSANPYEVFVVKLDPNGTGLWAAKAGGTGADIARALAVDAAGNAYVSGQFGSVAAFGNFLLPNAQPNAVQYPMGADVFVAKLSSQGQWLWAVPAGAGGGSVSSLLGLDAAGNPHVGGYAAAGTTRLGPFAFAGAGSFVAKLDAGTGRWRWVTRTAGELGDTYNGGNPSCGLALDGAGHTFITSYFTGTAQFGSTVLRSAGLLDMFVAKLDTSGAFQWAVRAGSPDVDRSYSLTTDTRGNCLLTGMVSLGAQFGATTLTTLGQDLFVAMLSPTGDWRWTQLARGAGSESTGAVAVGPGNQVHLGGRTTGPTVDFGNGVGVTGVPQLGQAGLVAHTKPYASLNLDGDSLLCQGGQVVLTATTTGVVSGYRWNTGETTPSITATQAGTYSVTVTFAGGFTLTETYRVRSIAPVVQLSGAGANLCGPGDVRVLRAAAPGAQSLRWNTGATTPTITVTQPGTYSVTAQYGSGCAVSAQVLLAANAVSISGRQQLCPGQSAVLTATTSGAAVTSYRWNTGATTAALRVGQAGQYSVTATFADGCTRTATHSVGPPVAKVATVSGDSLLCSGQILQLTALNPDALSYRWTTGDTTTDIRISRPGLYGVVLRYAGGCTSRDSLLVIGIPPVPAVSLGPDTTLCLEQPLLLRAPALSLPGGVRYRWSDGSTGATLLVTEPGTYSLELTTRCEVRTLSRRVSYASCLLLPNVITPNGDGRNDRLVLPGLTKGPWALEIYNRWGRQVYRSAAYGHDWGADAPSGVYYYRLSQGATVYKGQVEVIR